MQCCATPCNACWEWTAMDTSSRYESKPAAGEPSPRPWGLTTSVVLPDAVTVAGFTPVRPPSIWQPKYASATPSWRSSANTPHAVFGLSGIGTCPNSKMTTSPIRTMTARIRTRISTGFATCLVSRGVTLCFPTSRTSRCRTLETCALTTRWCQRRRWRRRRRRRKRARTCLMI